MTTYREVTPAVVDLSYDNGSVISYGSSGPTEIGAVITNDDDAGYTRYNSDLTTAYRYYYWPAGTARPADFDNPIVRVRLRSDTLALDATARLTLFVRNPTPTGLEDNYTFDDGLGGLTQLFSHGDSAAAGLDWATVDVTLPPYVTGHAILGTGGVGSLDLYDAYLAGNLAVRLDAETDGDGTNLDITYLALLINAGIPPLRQWPRDDGLRRTPRGTTTGSRQGSLRRGPRGNYT